MCRTRQVLRRSLTHFLALGANLTGSLENGFNIKCTALTREFGHPNRFLNFDLLMSLLTYLSQKMDF